MFVPRYWSEASRRVEIAGRRGVTLRRFGWASTTQADADAHARARVEEAATTLRAGGPRALAEFARRERKVAYGGPDGLPIREEIVEEVEASDVVLTRNAYGALCLNTRRAMFVDVDRPEGNAGRAGCLGALLGLALGAGAGPALFDASPFLGALVGMLAAGLATFGVRWLSERRDLHRTDPLRWALRRCREWCANRPDWLVAVYATPAGARLLPLHAPFDAGDPASFEFMAFVGADPLYERLCRLQKCFRARVSPKPWRAGVREHFRAGGTWPVRDAEKLATRAAWVRRYDRAARSYASCRHVETVGTGRVDARVDLVRRLHDERSRAGSNLDLA